MKWKEAPLDTAVLCLSYLQLLFCDMGNYSVKSDFSYLKVSAEDVQFPNNIYQPDAIIDKLLHRNPRGKLCLLMTSIL